MKKKCLSFIPVLLTLVMVSSCKKGPGEGGKASIHGTVTDNSYAYNRTQGHFNYLATYSGQGETVYIEYGNHITYDNSVKTWYDGSFEFPFLRPGDYTVLVYQKDTLKYLNGVPNPAGTVITSKTIEVKVKITISGKKDNVDAGNFSIIK